MNIGTLWPDIKYGLRMLRKAPGFTAVAVLSLAVGIGLNSVMFSLVNQTSLQSLPVREPQQVFTITGTTRFLGEHSSFAYLDRGEFLAQCPALADVVALNDESVVAQYREIPRRLHAQVVSRNYFSFFGLRPAVGRFFAEADGPDMQAEPAVVVSYSLWQRDLGGDPGVVGRSIQLDGRAVVVCGIAPKGFVGTSPWTPDDLWFPAEVYHTRLPRMLTLRSIASFSLLARLRPGVSVDAAEAEVKVVTRRLCETYPSEMRTRDAALSPLVQPKTAQYYLAVVGNLLLPGAVLALACANVSALLLARAQGRTQEIAARLALGGTRSRLVRQMLVESLLLALAGGAVGLLLATWAVRSLPSLLPPAVHVPLPELYVDGRMAIFTGLLAVVTTVCFGLLPAWHATKPGLAPLLKGDWATGRARGRFVGLHRIVIGQLTVSLVLLCVAGLFLRSFLRGLRAHPGFQRPDLLLVELNPREYGLELPQIPAYLRRVREALQSLPGVRQVAAVGVVPLEYNASGNQRVFLSREGVVGRGQEQSVHCNSVDEHLFGLMGFRVLAGRAFTRFDDASSAFVALVSQAAAQAYWPNQSALGQTLRLGDADGPSCEVVGVVADGAYDLSDGKPQPYFFFPISQVKLYGGFTLLAEARVPPRSLFLAARQAVHSVDERVLPVGIRTVHDDIRTSYAMFGRQFLARLFGAFGVLGLFLALIGLYAVTAYAVGRRTREIGIRMTVGATRGAIARMVLAEGLRLALLGVAVGLPIALAVAQLLRNGLYGFPPADPVTFVAVPLLLLGVTLVACWLPARRAARTDPMTALRYE